MHVHHNLYHQLCDGVRNVSTFSQSYIWEYFVKLTFTVQEKYFCQSLRLGAVEDAGGRRHTYEAG